MQSNIVLEIESLSFNKKSQSILENINLTVYERDFLALIGPNGGGKTTLLKLILGVYKTEQGSIKLYSNKLAYVPQNTNVNINFPITAIDVVMTGNLSNTNRSDALDVLKEVGMDKYAKRKIGSLSGGQRQRLMIARALFAKPEILLLDEPTSNIDVNGQIQVYELLRKLNETKTIIIVSHDLAEILKYINKVAHIKKTAELHDIKMLTQNFKRTSEDICCEVELIKYLEDCRC